MNNEIKNNLLEQLKEISENDNLTLSSDFKTENISSTDLIELSWFIEDNYGIYIETEDFNKFSNLKELIEWVEKNA